MLQINHIKEEGEEMNIIRQLFREYEKELNENLCFQNFETELKEPLKKYGPPSGDLLLAYWSNEPDSYRVAGCIAFTKTKADGVCEMKRLYVKPEFRKNKIGRALVEELLISAKEKNYEKMRLDTFTKLSSAIRLYENFGFKNIQPYYHNPHPGVVYMEKQI